MLDRLGETPHAFFRRPDPRQGVVRLLERARYDGEIVGLRRVERRTRRLFLRHETAPVEKRHAEPPEKSRDARARSAEHANRRRLRAERPRKRKAREEGGLGRVNRFGGATQLHFRAAHVGALPQRVGGQPHGEALRYRRKRGSRVGERLGQGFGRLHRQAGQGVLVLLNAAVDFRQTRFGASQLRNGVFGVARRGEPRGHLPAGKLFVFAVVADAVLDDATVDLGGAQIDVGLRGFRGHGRLDVLDREPGGERTPLGRRIQSVFAPGQVDRPIARQSRLPGFGLIARGARGAAVAASRESRKERGRGARHPCTGGPQIGEGRENVRIVFDRPANECVEHGIVPGRPKRLGFERLGSRERGMTPVRRRQGFRERRPVFRLYGASRQNTRRRERRQGADQATLNINHLSSFFVCSFRKR